MAKTVTGCLVMVATKFFQDELRMQFGPFGAGFKQLGVRLVHTRVIQDIEK